MKTITLNLSNFTQGNNLDTTVVDATKFKVRIPEYLRQRPYKIKVIQALIMSKNPLDQESFTIGGLPKNRIPFIRHNILTQSYDSSSSSSNTLIPVNFKLGSTNANSLVAQLLHPMELGQCYLPQEIVIERMRFIQDANHNSTLEPLLGEEDPNPADPATYVPVAERIALIHLSLELTYED